MDIDSFIDDLIDPVGKILREVNLDDIFNICGKPAKSVRVAKNLEAELEARKRALAFVVLDLGTNSKY